MVLSGFLSLNQNRLDKKRLHRRFSMVTFLIQDISKIQKQATACFFYKFKISFNTN
jgi:hypothetical protein